MDAMDIDERPLPPPKRQRVVEYTHADTEVCRFEALPTPVLLLALSNLLLHPPTHRQYSKSLYLSILATWKCLSYQNLDPDVECRAWTALAELGFRMGLGEQDVEQHVETAITKAHPTLRPYKVHLTVLSARISQHQRKFKQAQTTIRRLLSTFIAPNDLPNLVYTAHLAHIASFSTLDGSGSLIPSAQSLKAIQDFSDLATRNSHRDIIKLAAVLRLQTLVQMGSWDGVQEALNEAEVLLEYPTASEPSKLAESAALFAHTKRPLHDSALLIYALTLGIIFYTYVGDTPSVEARTKILHEMLDGGILDKLGYGVVEIPFPASRPLCIQFARPRILMVLAFLITSIAKRDPVGRKPKRKIFAMEGLLVVDKELKKDAALPPWASAADVEAHYSRLNKLKADLICELVGVAVMRSEFVEAERHLAEVISHTRNEGLWAQYSARITLLHAQLAHGLNQTDRALQCYQVAAYLSRKREHVDNDDDGMEDPWINAASRAGEVWLWIGMFRREMASYPPESINEEYVKEQEELLRKHAEEVVRTCEGLGSTLMSVACVLRAALTNEFLKAKMHLRQGLQLVTTSTDNHLKALIMALIASQYLNTSTEHAEAMLGTAEQLAAGLGAQPKAPKNSSSSSSLSQSQSQGSQVGGSGKPMDGVGNAALRLWIGERSAELKRRAGDDEAARVQDGMNHKLRAVVRKIEQRKDSPLVGGRTWAGATPAGGRVV
ncbi:hypothetical protein EST38_g12605 [Candolleomyces aberdarensis]|uniref:Uncharacterized protein n=1 Tax=Candolleomyces aberdarensis TaxID=2316362 RepID=A0A4Q2D210_9AGAR|nr:hypothetical protein EST38_g12605 [Candolleomyces aberdarensis]